MAEHVDRRTFLSIAGTAGAGFGFALAGASTAPVAASPRFRTYPFTLGVASGDPWPDNVVLWTRLAPQPLAEDGSGGMPQHNVPVQWEVAEDEGFRGVVRRGTVHATPELGHSVHAEVGGLLPGRDYFYRFRAGTETSPTGRTRTAPEAGTSPASLTFALASCQAWAGGRFASYRTMADEDLDLVVHVGDYVYEDGNHETLADFRVNHARYKTSVDLQTAHATFPFVVTFDDHEVENNWAGHHSQDDGEASNAKARFLALRAAAFQAYYEHMPLRRSAIPRGPDMRIYRNLRFGSLAEINVLDTRQYRDDQVNDQFPSGPLDPRALDPSRTLTGDAQQAWLFDNLAGSRARWNVLAQQTIMAHYDYDPGTGVSVNHDQWDGYAGSRQRFLDFLGEQRPSNPVVLTGDWHSSWVNDITLDPYDARSPVMASEFVGPSISSGCGWADAVAAALPANPQVKFFDGARRGYLRCTLTRDHWRSDYRVVTSAADTTDPATTLTSWVVHDGQPGAQPA